MFQDVHAHGLATKEGVKPGDVLIAINGNDVIPPIKPTVLGQSVTKILVGCAGGTKTVEVNTTTSTARPSNGLAYWLLHRDPNVYVHSSMLPGNIGYIRVAEFPGLIGVHVARQIDKAFHRVRRCRFWLKIGARRSRSQARGERAITRRRLVHTSGA
jgi:carboxyl-terminal processing protease